jgi:hypothetical protein
MSNHHKPITDTVPLNLLFSVTIAVNMVDILRRTAGRKVGKVETLCNRTWRSDAIFTLRQEVKQY